MGVLVRLQSRAPDVKMAVSGLFSHISMQKQGAQSAQVGWAFSCFGLLLIAPRVITVL